ncbi:S26 family signal peptidase [Asticcacaulis excentricus]|uniref:Peptidase S26, conserved region n=1 Tax=Asticcacaulis excentricus (strain ATCC 15261 / DSM 4724 / KCTC 12464 / NCIMB 9791 / VKM B-1370 / CB 48) TaxID=573065 RepID=E8RUQ6_ASTEC|nr:Peptidase S26, conserved region [Asticcacaulis excentricus CB 48]
MAAPKSPTRLRLRRGLVAGLSVAALVGLGLSAQPQKTPWLIYNASSSAPIGFYTVSPVRQVKTGDLVVVRLPQATRELADERRYVPATVPVLKHVAAHGGDAVCAIDASILVNGKRVTVRRLRDRRNRPLPWWQSCRRLYAGELFLLNTAAPDSFDSRYFGPVSLDHVIGEARPL